jgi:hypothetical protein
MREDGATPFIGAGDVARTPRQEAWRRHTVMSAVDTGKFWAQMGIGGPGAGPAEIGRALGLGPN